MRQVIVHVAANNIRRDGSLCGALINCARLEDAATVGEYVATRIMCVEEGRTDTFGRPFLSASSFEG